MEMFGLLKPKVAYHLTTHLEIFDSYSKNKFDALKSYAQKHPEIKWSFVRVIGAQLYLRNTEWIEDMTNHNIWKPVEVFI